ncbi:U3 snoRNP protein [Coemansia erecta]|uniref:U3 snoRNP protein n=1 Tax=Coemansia erecta TaxID=147472 RepID=A0A9W8CQX7_9FUNG|nr:U3 snoRNP protein [Coemansia erecta]
MESGWRALEISKRDSREPYAAIKLHKLKWVASSSLFVTLVLFLQASFYAANMMAVGHLRGFWSSCSASLFVTLVPFLQAQGIVHAGTVVVLLTAPIHWASNFFLARSATYGLGFIGAPIASVVSYWLMFSGKLLYMCNSRARQAWSGATGMGSTKASSRAARRGADDTQTKEIKEINEIKARQRAEDSDVSMDSGSESDEDEDEDENEGDEGEENSKPADAQRQGRTHARANGGGGDVLALHEAAVAVRSNVLRLQTESLLDEALVVAGSRATRGLDAALRQLRGTLLGLAPIAGPLSADAARREARRAGVAWGGSLPAAEPSVAFSFGAPSAVHVVGSYALGWAVRTAAGFTVDVAAQLPAGLVLERDHLNYRYVHKRAFFVAMLCAGLRASALGDAWDVTVETARDDARLGVVALRPKKGVRGLPRGCCVRVLPALAAGELKLARLGGGRNAVRPSYAVAGAADADADDSALPATPQYNAAVAGDALLVTHMRFLHDTAEACAGFGGAAALLRVWLAQRTCAGAGDGLRLRSGRLSAFALTMALAWLVRSGRVAGAGAGAAQLFRAAMEALATADFEAQPAAMGQGDGGFGAGAGAVLVDPTAAVNVLAGVADWELAEVRRWARATALDLGGGQPDGFARAFLRRGGGLAQRYDCVVRVAVPLAPFAAPAAAADAAGVARRLAELDHGDAVAAARARLAALLGAALDAQARLVAVHAAADGAADGAHVFFVGLAADARTAGRMVALGPDPDADGAAAARFRALWGGRCELRRFRDGAIRLACVWGAGDAPERQRAAVLPRSAAFLLLRHFRAASAGLLSAEDERLAAESAPRAAAPFAAAHVPGSAAALAPALLAYAAPADEHVLGALEQLTRELRAVEDQLPLRVLALHAAAPGLRMAAGVRRVAADGDAPYIAAQHVAVEFAASARWPDDLAALHKVKAAFLLRLAEVYGAAHPHARVAVSDALLGVAAADGVLPAPDACALDIRHAALGLAFRLTVRVDHERTLLERRVAALARVPQLHAQHAAALAALARWTRFHVHAPMHHRRMLALAQRFPAALPMAARLLKRWLACHMLLAAHLVPEELAELLVAHVFTAGNADAPVAPVCAFLRALHVLATWRWKADVCVVDFARATAADAADDDGEPPAGPAAWARRRGMSPEARALIDAAFERAGDANAGLRVASEDDPEAAWFGCVPPVLTRRLAGLARASLACLDRCLISGDTSAELPQVFAPPLADYSFLLRLDRRAVCRRDEQPRDPARPSEALPQRAEVFKNLALQDADRDLRTGLELDRSRPNPFGQPGLVDFDPVALYVRDLHQVYGSALMLFNDVYGGDVIAGLWTPEVAGPLQFAATCRGNLRPARDDELVDGDKARRVAARFNAQAVVDEIVRLGDGLVADVVVQHGV